jgi:hypothetical protein
MSELKSNSFLQKIEKLKNWSKSIVSGALDSEYFKSLPADYVGSTGLTREDIEEKILRIANCAENILVQKIQNEKPLLYDADFCRLNSVCPICASRIGSLRRKKLKEPILQAAKDHPFAYLITLTNRNRKENNWMSQTEKLKKAFRRFQKMGQCRYKKQYKVAIKGFRPAYDIGNEGDYFASEKLNLIWLKKGGHWQEPKQLYSECESRKFKAGFYSIELKRGGGSGLPHPHLHMMVFTDEMIDTRLYDEEIKKELTEKYGTFEAVPEDEKRSAALYPFKKFSLEGKNETALLSKFALQWYTATENEGYITDVQLIKRIPDFTKGNEWKAQLYEKMTRAESIQEQSREVLKYTTKLNQHSGNDVVEILDETSGVRFFATFGEFYRIIRQDEYRDESIELDKGEIYNYQFNSELRGHYNEKGIVTDLIRRDNQSKFIKNLYLSRQAKMLGRYKNRRKAVVYAGLHQTTCNTAKLLNKLKYEFRDTIKSLWNEYKAVLLNIDSHKKTGANQVFSLAGINTYESTYDIAFPH